ncbi:SET domain-containing protein SmydA-8-like isoform X2 [Belonocnema kinseyi]|uniref:SET domain-containing protein SmydA-8-like isoform X2 n=1 Tax=Belonocnema kinseyi TaxID=2817044 RepID=UPI00143DADE7|nr:SET domain-containing protein SmydA-8-like isoform X2 [Belonocnema kinseyi]
MTDLGKCEVCAASASQKCGGCGTVLYCNREHQAVHWPKHKIQCSPVKITFCSKIGRHMVATRKIYPGDLILKESPFILGPKVAPLPVCVGCLREFDKVDYCRSCGWPVCESKCSNSFWHLKECESLKNSGCNKSALIKFGGKNPVYGVLTPLRCLLLSSRDMEKLNSLQSHLEERSRTALYQAYRKSIVPAIRETLKMPYDENDILKVCAILDTNTFDIRTGRRRGRGIYCKSAMMAHNCLPNTRHIFEEETLSISIYATREISKNESVTATYTQTLWDTARRRAHLKIAKCFDCTCERCCDPTELGTFASSILCCICGGLVVSTNPLENYSQWKCSKCNQVFSGRQIALKKEEIRSGICSLNFTQADKLEEYLINHKKIVHGTNSYVLEINYALTQLYDDRFSKFKDLEEKIDYLTENKLKRRIELCRLLLSVADKIDPGFTRWRGQLLLSLQEALFLQEKLKEYPEKQKNQEKFNEAKTILQEATKILKIESDFAPLLSKHLSNLKSLT